MSQHPEYPAGQRERNEDENSDSGDSLFITQLYVPEAVRSQRRRRATLRSETTFSDGPVNEDYIFPVTDSGKSDTDRERKGQTNRLPKLSFSFLSENWQRSIELPSQQNRKLHYALMGGFFKCVREKWEGYQKGEDLVESQPTIDMVGVHIAPISEEEDGLEDEDIKVVDKKLFVVPSKAKRSKPWYNPEETNKMAGRPTQRPSVAGFESQRRQRKRIAKGLMWKPSLKSVPPPGKKHSNDGNTSHAVLRKGKTGDQVTSDDNVEAQAEPQSLKRAKRTLFNPKENEKELNGNSSATVCQLSPKKAAEMRRERSAAAVQPQSDGHREREPESQILLQGDDDTPCSEIRVKKKKMKDKHEHEAVEEGRDQSQEEAEGRNGEASVSAGITEVEEAPSVSQATDEPEPPGSKQKKRKKKRKRTKSAAEDVDGQTDGKMEEDSVLNSENGGKKKKKKRKSDRTDVEMLQPNTLTEHVTDSEAIKKKKRKKEPNETSDPPQIPTEHLETGESLEKTLELSRFQRKKHKKKKRGAFSENHAGEGSYTDVDFNNDAVNSSVSTGWSVQKKSISETCVDVSYTPEEDKTADDAQEAAESLEERDAAGVTKKKKKKKKLSLSLAEETETLSDYAASARKKKTSSFLVADEEEDASVAGNPAVSEAAEISGRLGQSKKKKKKRSAEENAERETEIEPPKETGQRVPSETGVRSEKKKRKRNESELISSADRAADVEDSQTHEAVVVGKKKKKKKGKKAIPPAAEDPETGKPCASFSPKKTAKHARSSTISDESSFCNDQESRETPGQDTSLSLSTPKDMKKKKKAKAAHSHVLKVKSLMDPAEVETPRSKKKERKEPTAEGRLSSSLSQTSLSQLKTSPSNYIRENKPMKGKRRLHNPNEDLL